MCLHICLCWLVSSVIGAEVNILSFSKKSCNLELINVPRENTDPTVSTVLSSPPLLPLPSYLFLIGLVASLYHCLIPRRICLDNKCSINSHRCVKRNRRSGGNCFILYVCVWEMFCVYEREGDRHGVRAWEFYWRGINSLWVGSNELVRRCLMGYSVWTDPDDWLSMRLNWII